MMFNSAQHARSAASRLDDVIDRSALEQAREGLGGRDTEEAAHLDSERKIRKITFEVRGRRSPRNSHPYDRVPLFGTLGLRDGKEPNALSTTKALLFVRRWLRK